MHIPQKYPIDGWFFPFFYFEQLMLEICKNVNNCDPGSSLHQVKVSPRWTVSDLAFDQQQQHNYA